jgi:hypothetical protein
MKPQFIARLGATMFVSALLLCVSHVQAGKKSAPTPAPPPPSTMTPNAVVAVDLQNLTLKVASANGKSSAVYNVTLLTETVVNGKSAKLEDIKVGMTANVTATDGNNASRIEAKGGLPPVKPTPKKKK